MRPQDEFYAHRFALADDASPEQRVALLSALGALSKDDEAPDGQWMVRLDPGPTSAWFVQASRSLPPSLTQRLIVEVGLGTLGDSLAWIRQLRSLSYSAGFCTALRIESGDLELLDVGARALNPDCLLMAPDLAAEIVARRDQSTMERLRAECQVAGAGLIALGAHTKRVHAWLLAEGVGVLADKPKPLQSELAAFEKVLEETLTRALAAGGRAHVDQTGVRGRRQDVSKLVPFSKPRRASGADRFVFNLV
jgi:hypothetical protein